RIAALQEESLRLQQESSTAINKLLRLRKQKRLLQTKSEAEAARLSAELEAEDAAERERLGVEELPVENTSESVLVEGALLAGAVDTIDWDTVFSGVPLAL